MPLNSIPPTVSVPALAEKRRAASGQAHVDVAFWGGAVPGNVPDLEPLHEAGVVGFKAFLVDSGVPEFGHLDDTGLRAALEESARLGTRAGPPRRGPRRARPGAGGLGARVRRIPRLPATGRRGAGGGTGGRGPA